MSAVSPFLIRPARSDDAETIARFNRAMALETEDLYLAPATVGAGVRRLLATPDDGFYLVAEREGRPVGQTMVTFEWSDWRDGRFWWIQSVYVLPEERRQGCFRALYERVVADERAAERVCGVRLYVHRENRGARITYADLGMTETPYRLFELEF